jgi:hypothetical protein
MVSLKLVGSHGTKRLRTSYRSLLSDALEDVCHTIFLPNISGGFEVTVCTGALVYFMSHQLEILSGNLVMTHGHAFAWTTYTRKRELSGTR